MTRAANCMVRGPPPPRYGLPVPTSGVAWLCTNPDPLEPVPKSRPVVPPGVNGARLVLVTPPNASTEKLGISGLLKFAWLKMLKISA